MKKIPKAQKSGYVILTVVSIAYIALFFVNSDKTYLALMESFSILKMIAPIILIVFFIMAMLNSSIDSKAISKHLGEDSGIKGWMIALIGGILSHGPGYVWYPMLQELRDKGAKDGLVVAFIYARSIKLPWLPVMISYFGIYFTILLSIYVILGAFIQGIIIDKLRYFK